jgi:DNA-binding MarR family transcriptional regulator
MANHFRKSFDRPVAVRQLLVAEADIAAGEKLLRLLANADGIAGKPATRRQRPGDEGTSSRSHAAAEAAFAFALRQRRLKVFGESFTAEAPFAMLLTLYVHGDREPDMSVRSLTKLAWLPYTTVVRWVQDLERDGWIERNHDITDRRKVKGGIKLSDRARTALEQAFSWAEADMEGVPDGNG